jgi:hypothetical protein
MGASGVITHRRKHRRSARQSFDIGAATGMAMNLESVDASL